VIRALPAVIPSPTQGVWHLGPLPLRAYALCILAGIVVCILIGERRWVERGGRQGTILDVAAYAVPAGIVGGRVYHVITSPQAYFGEGGDPVKALYIWEGGLGIWGAVVLGGVGAWYGCRRVGVKLPPLADTIAPGIVIAQAIGRLGNWFNNELYGKATDLPWGLRVYDWDTSAGRAKLDERGEPEVLGTFHPAFAYEAFWDVGTAAVLVWADRRWRLGHGRVFALYVVLYCAGRAWIEALRIDPANHILGLRLNLWTSAVGFLGGLAYLVISARRRPGREDDGRRGTPAPQDGAVQDSGGAGAGGSPSTGSTDKGPDGGPGEKDEKDDGDADHGQIPEAVTTSPDGARQDAGHDGTRGPAPAG
jgi:prolipoprotein diacylglyceryl transferase